MFDFQRCGRRQVPKLIEFLQRGCGAAPQFDVGLRRRNNELNELTNCRAARGRRFELIEFLRGSGHTGGPARAESPTSPEPRATPWVPCPHSLRPVRAKVKANRSPILLPLQGVGRLYTDTQGVALGCELAALSGRSRRGSRGSPARAESPTSPEPRATPWVNVRTAPAPCKGKSNKQQVRPYFCPYRAQGFIPWYPGRCPGWGLAALSGRSRRISSLSAPARPRNSLIRVIRCYAV